MSLLKNKPKKRSHLSVTIPYSKERKEQDDGIACEKSNRFLIFLGYQYFFDAEYFGSIFGESSWLSQPATQSSGIPFNRKSR